LKRYLYDKIDPLFRKEYRDSGLVPKEKMREILMELSEFGLISGGVSEANGGMGIDFPDADDAVRGGLRLRHLSRPWC
jgi:hypothetical protein